MLKNKNGLKNKVNSKTYYKDTHTQTNKQKKQLKQKNNNIKTKKQ